MIRLLAKYLLIFAAVTLITACARTSEHAATSEDSPPANDARVAKATDAPATQPSEAPKAERADADDKGGTFKYDPAAVEISWPAGWKRGTVSNYEWAIVPSKDAGQDQSVSMDIPDLPPHIPGMIPVSRVCSSYVKHLGEKNGKVDKQDLTPPSIPDASMKMVRCSWSKDGKGWQETGLLIVHADHVYIFRASSDTEHEKATRETFDKVVQSLKWK